MLKVGVVKLDYNIIGGFEIVAKRIQQELVKRNYDIDLIEININEIVDYGREIFDVSHDLYHLNAEFFNLIFAIHKFEGLDLSNYDVIISTQPPSYAINHDQHISIFYHHFRKFYDMFNIIKESDIDNMDNDILARSVKIVREIEKKLFDKNIVFLPGSKNIANRLKHFNNISIDDDDIFYAGVDDEYFHYNGEVDYLYPLSIGRHEFPKRVELFIAAIAKLGCKASVIGEGGYTEDYKKLINLIENDPNNLEIFEDENLWRNFKQIVNDINIDADIEDSDKIKLTGALLQNELQEELSKALCVVCPAYDEDYGLTPIEAMCFKKPVIVCNDGGGLTESVIDGVTGFIVEPNIHAIAEKIKFFIDHPQEARKMGEEGYKLSRKYQWKTAIDLLDTKIKELSEA